MSRRDQIKMSDGEVEAFLREERTVTCATIGPRGWPHLMPLWYVIRRSQDGAPQLWAWTYRSSQKAVNLSRDPRATLQVEAGETYDELRGVMLECDVEMHEDIDVVQSLGLEIFRRYGAPRGQAPLAELAGDVEAMVSAQAQKRIGLQFVERKRASWDHRKLGGMY